jgi:selenocysteine lyase/cysteine desulfurase
MRSTKYDRRIFLAAIAASAAGGAFINADSPLSAANAGPDRFLSDHESKNDYLYADGLTYLNTGTLGPCRREIIQESIKMWEELESFPVKYYGKFGAEGLAEKTRSIAAKFLGCDLSEILITTSTTSGMNAIAQGLRLKAGDRILTTNHEHGGGLLGWEYLAKYFGVKIDTVILPKDENNPDAIVEKIRKNIGKKTKLISVSHVFSSTGLRMPIADISALARSKGILCIVDGAQAAGAIEVNVKKLGCHAYATSGHKWLMGPKGTGLLYLSKDAQSIIRPMQFEESYNTYSNGNGVVNLPCILGLGKAIEYLESIGIDRIEEHNLLLRNRLRDKIKNLSSLTILSPSAESLSSPMLTCLLADRFERTAFVKLLLDKYKLSIRPTHEYFGFNGIRFSMHIFNTENDVDFAANALREELST